jgi:predicted transcriptional regulator of viral defense system
MDWNKFLNRFAEQPLFHSTMLDIFPDPPAHRQVQLSRWTKAGKLSQVCKSWYMIEKPWRKHDIPLPVIANSIVHPSYLSLEWALQYYDMIPEYVPNPTSITTGRGMHFEAQGTLFLYYHVQPTFFKGYRQDEVGGFKINIAYPEKALLDKIYLFLQRNQFSMPWLEELRLQELDEFNIERFEEFASGLERKNYREAVEKTCAYIRRLKGESL